MTLPERGWKGYGRPGYQCHAMQHVASIQIIACDAFRYGDLSMTRAHTGPATMACIPVRHRDAIAAEVAAFLWIVSLDSRA